MSSIDPRLITAAGRDAAEALMTDTCRIERVGEVVTSDDGVDSATPVLIYEGMCRAKPLVSRSAAGGSQGAAPVGDFQYTLSVPIAVVGVQYADRVTITDSLDPSMPGVVIKVGEVERGSQITARRMRCVEVSR